MGEGAGGGGAAVDAAAAGGDLGSCDCRRSSRLLRYMALYILTTFGHYSPADCHPPHLSRHCGRGRVRVSVLPHSGSC